MQERDAADLGERHALLRAEIEEVLTEWSFYGYRRVTRELRRRGTVANHERVARIMREEALTPHRVRRFVTTTDSKHGDLVYPNLAGDILPSGPDHLMGFTPASAHVAEAQKSDREWKPKKEKGTTGSSANSSGGTSSGFRKRNNPTSSTVSVHQTPAAPHPEKIPSSIPS